MNWLIAGLLLWTLLHLMPSLTPSLKSRLVAGLSPGLYKGMFAFLIVIGLAMIVVGWRSAMPVPVYRPPAWGTPAAFVLMFFAVLLFGAAHARTNIKRILRHPQLTGVLLWSIAHLLSNGDSRSLLLFGGLAVWAAVEIPVINRRAGVWIEPKPAGLRNEVINMVVAVLVFGLLIALHPYFAGESLLPAW